MLEYYAISEKGSRKVNEDSLGYLESAGCHFFVVADGLGGQGLGDEASRLTVIRILDEFSRNTLPMSRFVPQVLHMVQTELRQKQRERNKISAMMSTVVIAAIEKERITIASVGDTRAYLFFETEKVWRTTDQSVPQMLALAGEIKEAEISHHPDRNKLLQALGGDANDLKFEVVQRSTEHLKAVLLCTDGLWEYVDTAQLQDSLKRSDSVQQWVKTIEKTAVKNARKSDMDNYTAIGIILDVAE